MTNSPLAEFFNRFLKQTSSKNPQKVQHREPFSQGYPLSPNNFAQAMGAPGVRFPGAIGLVNDPSYEEMRKKQLIYGEVTQGSIRNIRGGYTYFPVDNEPSGSLFNAGQV